MKLTFPVEELKKCYDDALVCWKREVRPTYGEVTGPGFWLVGDQGVYIMHNGAFKEDRVIVYANECNPDKLAFDQWWDTKRSTFGGDDGVDFLDPSIILKAVQRNADLLVGFSSKHMSVDYSEPKK